MMEPVLSMRDVSVWDEQGRTLLYKAALTVLPGERVRVVAEPPCFEALARLIGGLTTPSAGEFDLRGEASYAPNAPCFWERMTVLQNVALPLTARGVPRRQRERTALDTLESLGIGPTAHLYPKSLSLADARLAAIARALVTAPALLLLADPLSMLGTREQARLSAALRRRWEAAPFAVLYQSRSGNAPFSADRTCCLHPGEESL